MIDFGIRTLFSPDDDTAGEFIKWLSGAQKSIHIAIYGFHLPNLLEVLIAKQKDGVGVHLVMDRTQAMGHAEHPEVDELIKNGVDVVIGTSQKHRIMHNKFTVVDELEVEDGSWNYSESASLESNVQNYVRSKERAALFLDKWNEIHDWILKNEPKYQEVEASEKV